MTFVVIVVTVTRANNFLTLMRGTEGIEQHKIACIGICL